MSALPSGFAGLEPLAVRWALPSENARSQARWRSTADEFRGFYSAMMPRLDEVLHMLEGYPPDAMPPDVHRLFLLACAFAEAAPHHELYGDSPDVPFSFAAPRFRAMHGDDAQ